MYFRRSGNEAERQKIELKYSRVQFFLRHNFFRFFILLLFLPFVSMYSIVFAPHPFDISHYVPIICCFHLLLTRLGFARRPPKIWIHYTITGNLKRDEWKMKWIAKFIRMPIKEVEKRLQPRSSLNDSTISVCVFFATMESNFQYSFSIPFTIDDLCVVLIAKRYYLIFYSEEWNRFYYKHI